jgi:hypothetical protein
MREAVLLAAVSLCAAPTVLQRHVTLVLVRRQIAEWLNWLVNAAADLIGWLNRTVT